MRLAVVLFAIAGCGRLGFTAHVGSDGALANDGVLASDGAVADAAPRANYAFITSTQQVPGGLAGLAGADAVCNVRAAAAGLPGVYVAWLSTPTTNARDRLAGARGWIRPDGRPIADRVSDLTAGTIWYPLDEDETGTVSLGVFAITSTNGDGTYASGGDCTGYTSMTGMSSGGSPNNGGYYWTLSEFIPTGCNSTFTALYCFGVSENTAVTPPPIASRRAFLLSGWAPNTGLAAADTACQNAANGASLGGTFHALLGTTTATAASRFNVGGLPWARLDGVPIVATAAALGTGNLIAPLNLSPTGYELVGQQVWAGAVTTVGGATTNCTNWSSTAGTGSTMSATSYGTGAWSQPNAIACNSTGFELYCLEP